MMTSQIRSQVLTMSSVELNRVTWRQVESIHPELLTWVSSLIVQAEYTSSRVKSEYGKTDTSFNFIRVVKMLWFSENGLVQRVHVQFPIATNDKTMVQIDHRFFHYWSMYFSLTHLPYHAIINNIHEHVHLWFLIENNQNKYFDCAFLKLSFVCKHENDHRFLRGFVCHNDTPWLVYHGPLLIAFFQYQNLNFDSIGYSGVEKKINWNGTCTVYSLYFSYSPYTTTIPLASWDSCCKAVQQ